MAKPANSALPYAMAMMKSEHAMLDANLSEDFSVTAGMGRLSVPPPPVNLDRWRCKGLGAGTRNGASWGRRQKVASAAPALRTTWAGCRFGREEADPWPHLAGPVHLPPKLLLPANGPALV